MSDQRRRARGERYASVNIPETRRDVRADVSGQERKKFEGEQAVTGRQALWSGFLLPKNAPGMHNGRAESDERAPFPYFLTASVEITAWQSVNDEKRKKDDEARAAL